MFYVIVYRVFQGRSHAERFYGTRDQVTDYRAWAICMGHSVSGIREA